MHCGNAFLLETEAPEETAVADKETAQPIEEASTMEAIVPTGESDVLNKLHLSFRLGLWKQMQPVQCNKQLAALNKHSSRTYVTIKQLL